MKPIVLVLSTLASLVCAPATATFVLGTDLWQLTVLSNTYTSMGDGAIVYGNVLADTYITAGANSIVFGELRAGGVLTLGDSALVTGDAQSIASGTLGANATVNGNLEAGLVGTIGDTAIVFGNFISGLDGTVGANAIVEGNFNVGSDSIATVSASGYIDGTSGTTDSEYMGAVESEITRDLATAIEQLIEAKTRLSAMGPSQGLATTMTVDSTFTAGIFNAANWSMTAGTTLTLDAQGLDNQMWVFNFKDYFAIGGTSKVELINEGDNAQVFWNSNGYAFVGDGADFVGIILATAYISIDANAVVRNTSDQNSAGLYSSTSYVSVGANAIVGSVPEPATYTLLSSGLGIMMGMSWIVRRRSNKTALIKRGGGTWVYT